MHNDVCRALNALREFAHEQAYGRISAEEEIDPKQVRLVVESYTTPSKKMTLVVPLDKVKLFSCKVIVEGQPQWSLGSLFHQLPSSCYTVMIPFIRDLQDLKHTA